MFFTFPLITNSPLSVPTASTPLLLSLNCNLFINSPRRAHTFRFVRNFSALMIKLNRRMYTYFYYCYMYIIFVYFLVVSYSLLATRICVNMLMTTPAELIRLKRELIIGIKILNNINWQDDDIYSYVYFFIYMRQIFCLNAVKIVCSHKSWSATFTERWYKRVELVGTFV